MSHIAYIGIGTNLGDRRDNYRKAIAHMGEMPESRVVSQSSVYESEPHGRARNWFLNGVVGVETELDAKVLLKQLQKIEKEMGRKPTSGKASVSRVMDLDLLLFDTEVIETRTLKVPHPEMANRRFVLLPLSELAPATKHPQSGATVSSMLVATEDATKVMLYRP